MIQVPLIKELVCYICGKGVTEKDSVRIGGGLRRHRKCRPNAKRRRDSRSELARQPRKQDAIHENTDDRLFP